MMNKRNEGITLIALVITIIVLLILVGVSINAVIGENGIATKAKDSKEATIVAEEQELVDLAYSGAYANNEGKTVTLDDMLESLEGLKADVTVMDNGDGTLKVTFEETGNEYTVETNSEIDWDLIVTNIPTKYEEYLEQAEAKGQDIDSEVNVGIGTDGKVVNLSLWHYYKTDDGNGMSLGKGDGCVGSCGYDEENLVDGKIQGKMPQYIYIQSENKVYPVILLETTFLGTDDLYGIKEFPELPSTVVSIGDGAFCKTALTNVIIPDTVTSIGVQAFYYCFELENIIIPNSVTSIGSNAFVDVPHISYSGTASGAPWGALSIN